MSFFFDGRDPVYDEELILSQNITAILTIRDLCLLMRHARLNAQSITGGGYEYNQLQLEIFYLEKIIRLLDKILVRKLDENKDTQQFYSKTLSSDLGLDEIVPGKYFDKEGAFNNRYETVKLVRVLFKNFSHAIDSDWKFL